MKTLRISVTDDINIADLFTQLKKLYPTSQIEALPMYTSRGKHFAGISDLKPLRVNNFKVFQREELYDR
jgi:hypothetical protein